MKKKYQGLLKLFEKLMTLQKIPWFFFFSIREVLKKKMATYTGSMITFLPYKNKRT